MILNVFQHTARKVAKSFVQTTSAKDRILTSPDKRKTRKKMAEREGFEPPVPCDTLDFESSTLDHSDISPGLLWVRFYQIDLFPSSRISLQAYPPVFFGKPDCPVPSCRTYSTARARGLIPRALTRAALTLHGMAIMRGFAVGRDGRPQPPVGVPHPPGSRRRAIGAVRGLESWNIRTRGVHGALRTRITHAHYPAARWTPAGAPGSRPTAVTPRNIRTPTLRPEIIARALRTHYPRHCPLRRATATTRRTEKTGGPPKGTACFCTSFRRNRL